MGMGGDHGEDAHDGALGKRVQQFAAGLGHLVAAEAEYLEAGPAAAQFADEVGTVEVAGRLAGAEGTGAWASLPRWGWREEASYPDHGTRSNPGRQRPAAPEVRADCNAARMPPRPAK